mgnify:FL=1
MSLNKSCILSAILKCLYREMQDKLVTRYSEIHISNQRLNVSSVGGFYFKGKHYRSGLAGFTGTLHPALYEFMEDYTNQCKDIANERAYVSSYIQSVLNQCTEESQLYYHFPSGLHSILRDEGLDETPTSNLGMVPAIDFNQKGKELLLARMMLNMTGN